MRRIHSTVSVLAVAAMLGGLSLVPSASANDNTNQQKDNQQQSEANSSNSKTAPEGFVLVDEQTVMLTANEPQNHFVRAQEYLSQNDPRAAAAEIRIGAAYLDMQAARKGEADQKGLQSASAHLKKAADELCPNNKEAAGQNAKTSAEGQASANGKVPDRQRLDHMFAMADRALAQHFQEEAKAEIGKQKPIMAGEDLDAAVSTLTASLAWTNHQASQECAKAMTDARKLSNQLLTPPGEGQAENNATDQQADQKKTAASDTSEAQPASARISGDKQEADRSNTQIPQDANQVVDDLGKAIQSASPKHQGADAQKKAGENGQPANSDSTGNK